MTSQVYVAWSLFGISTWSLCWKVPSPLGRMPELCTPSPMVRTRSSLVIFIMVFIEENPVAMHVNTTLVWTFAPLESTYTSGLTGRQKTAWTHQPQVPQLAVISACFDKADSFISHTYQELRSLFHIAKTLWARWHTPFSGRPWCTPSEPGGGPTFLWFGVQPHWGPPSTHCLHQRTESLHHRSCTCLCHGGARYCRQFHSRGSTGGHECLKQNKYSRLELKGHKSRKMLCASDGTECMLRESQER